MQLVERHPFKTEVKLLPNVQSLCHNAGHILGAAIVEMNLTGNTQTKEIVFSGDLDAITTPS